MELIIASGRAKEQNKMNKTLKANSKGSRLLGLPKLEDANWAGTK